MKYLVILFLFIGLANSARILAFFFFPSKSHQFIFRSIVKELSSRGHEVTFITPNPLKDPELKNLTEVDTSVAYEIFAKTEPRDYSRETMDLFSLGCGMEQFIEDIIAGEMEVKGVQEILKKPENSYDLILVEALHPFFTGLKHKFKAPLISVSSFAIQFINHYTLGNPVHPHLYPDIYSDYQGPLKNIWQKIDSIYIHLVFYAVKEFFVFPRSDKMARSYFGQDMPYLKDTLKDVSLMFSNVNPIFSDRRPLVPNVVEVWNIHLDKTQKPLPKDLQQILDNAKNGVVYFSLGTNVRFDGLPGNLKEDILKALGEIPYTVLCKWESETVPGISKNIILRTWLPQQAILAHPNVKLYVMQGGLQSSDEAIANGIPVVVMPFFADQPLNAKILTNRGMAETVFPYTLTKESFKDTILKVANDKKYRLKAKELQNIFLDQQQTGMEQIIWWCEYVIRHKGAKHLRSPSADIALYEYLMLDVLAIILAALFVTYKVISKVWRFLVGCLSCCKPKQKVS